MITLTEIRGEVLAVAKTQEEFDEIVQTYPRGFKTLIDSDPAKAIYVTNYGTYMEEVRITKNSKVYAQGGCYITARDNCQVIASDNCIIMARDSCCITAGDECYIAILLDGPGVVVYANSCKVAANTGKIIAKGRSFIEAWGDSIVEASENASVLIGEETAKVTLSQNASMKKLVRSFICK